METEDLEFVRVDAITVEGRHRKDLDLDPLVESIKKYGLLQPIGVTPEYKLVFGERRLRACMELGWTHIQCMVRERDQLKEEFDENVVRKEFTPIEMYNIGQALEEEAGAAAAERQKAGKKVEDGPSGNLPEGSKKEKGDTRDVVANMLGTSGKTYEKTKAVMRAAEEDPERYGHLVDKMEETGKVNAAYTKLKKLQDEERIQTLEPVEGKFRTLIIDPPWKDTTLSDTMLSKLGYALMDIEEIEDIDPAQWADDEFCHLYLWVPNNFMYHACRVMDIWGFDHKTVLTWKKPNIGMGSYFRNQTEHVLFGTRGKTQVTRVDDIPNIFEGSTGVDQHSAKPEEFRDIVERASYGPYGEAFQRAPRDGFTNLYKEGVLKK